jgi:MFS family permease
MTKLLYNFLGIHSLIIWMFTFFLPVLLYKTGYSLVEISLFISMPGFSFVIFLVFWDILRVNKWMKYLIYTSFILETLLISLWFFITNSFLFLTILAVLYWAFNCFFWVTQRILFIADADEKNTGSKFWNIQIIAFLLVKIGIFIGWFLLENNYLPLLLLITVLLNVYWFYYFFHEKFDHKSLEGFQNHPVLKFKDIMWFKDTLNSKIIFIIDGPFLFLESFFWLLTLFFITNQSYSELGLLVIFLGLSFSIIFIFLKNFVDKVNPKNILYIWVLLYWISWLFRWFVSDITDTNIVYWVILIIAFFTSFFRLIFNKQFFHTSKKVDTHNYMLIKSYYSQIGLSIFFWILAVILYLFPGNIAVQLNIIYFSASLVTLLFLLYIPVLNTVKK